MNVTALPVSFLPASAAQPTDVLRRDNAMREVVSAVPRNEAFARERGLGSDAERQTLAQERSYAQQLADARIEFGFPAFLQRVDERSGSAGREQNEQSPDQEGSDQDWLADSTSASSTTLTYRSADGSYDGTMSLREDGRAIDSLYQRFGAHIEKVYQGSFRPREQFLIGVA